MKQTKFTQQLKDIKALTDIKKRYDKLMDNEIKHHEKAINSEFPDLLKEVRRCVKEGDKEGLKVQMDIIKDKREKELKDRLKDELKDK